MHYVANYINDNINQEHIKRGSMRITHSFGKLRLGKEIGEDVQFLLANKRGGFCGFSAVPTSRYQGLYFEHNWILHKSLETIELINAPEIKEIKHNFWNVERIRQKLTESFFYPLNTNTLVYELSQPWELELKLDCKQIYDNREFGREYEITEESGLIVIKFKKVNDWREQPQGDEYEFYVVISGDKHMDHTEIKEWKHWYYNSDFQRKSTPYDRHVFSALRMRAKMIYVTAAMDKQEALEEHWYVLRNVKQLKEQQKKYIMKLLKPLPKKTKVETETQYALTTSAFALDQLTMQRPDHRHGIYAGLPWFFQFWARDELVSVKALMLMGKYEYAKEILLKYLNEIKEDGRLANRIPSVATGCADGIGWLFKRIADFLDVLDEHGLRSKFMTDEELEFVKEKLKKSLEALEKRYKGSNGMFRSDPKETWMDTDVEGDNRAGYRIEIQALTLHMYHLMYALSKDQSYQEKEQELLKTIRAAFWNNQYLLDGTEDPTIRPNIFIAHYVYPDLLSKEQWTTCFDAVLPRLWCPWGGLASIEKNHPLFTPLDSGEETRSYHRGDSWFWVNNLAALSLLSVNAKKFAPSIKAIVNASTDEILWKGSIGCHAEISSAMEFKSLGCLNQAWSDAMFIELVYALK